MRKAILITIFRVPNYGSVLQAYASIKLMKELGYDCDIIDYVYPNEWHYSHGSRRYKKSIIKKLALSILGSLGIKKGVRQSKKLNKFISSNFSLTQRFSDLTTLREHDWSKCNVAIVGSDQVWNPKYLHGDSVFMLSFIPDNICKTSIASSFAVSSVPDELKVKYAEYLNRFSSLTVREHNGKSILQHIVNPKIPVDVVLDPTLLICADSWKSTLNCPQIKTSKKYLLFYYLEYSFKSAPYIFEVVKFLSKKHNLEIRTICGEQTNTIGGNIGRYIDESGCGVERFIALFADASMVVTSSFHGTAFAVNFARPLIAITPKRGDDRQTTLLESVGLRHCAVTVNTPLASLNPEYDYDEAKKRLNDLRNQSVSIIKRNLTELS